jgi:hydroxypyruvate isomerase
MPKFAANLSMLFTELPFLERFQAAHGSGFQTVEYLFPYEYEKEQLNRQLTDNRLRQVLFNLPAGNWAQGDRGIAAHPARIEEFRRGVHQAVEYALALQVPRLNCLAGKRLAACSEKDQGETLVANVQYAADVLGENNLQLVIEAINHFDMPGFLLNKTEQVLQLLEAVNRPNVAIQYDVYHAQREEGELTATIRKYLDKIGHIQIADNPGRHQPGTGEINFPFLLQELDTLNYQGYVGLEYIPIPETICSFDWIPSSDLSIYPAE